MNIKYTRRSSGYIAAILALITIKVFFEAILLGRGPLSGLSFLLYTLFFYVHYAFDDIEKTCIHGYSLLVELYSNLQAFEWEGLIPDAYTEYLKTNYYKILSHVKKSITSLELHKFDVHKLSRPKLSEIQALKLNDGNQMRVNVENFFANINKLIDENKVVLLNFSKNVYNWVRAISIVVTRKILNFIRSLSLEWLSVTKDVVTEKVIQASDDTN